MSIPLRVRQIFEEKSIGFNSRKVYGLALKSWAMYTLPKNIGLSAFENNTFARVILNQIE